MVSSILVYVYTGVDNVCDTIFQSVFLPIRHWVKLEFVECVVIEQMAKDLSCGTASLLGSKILLLLFFFLSQICLN